MAQWFTHQPLTSLLLPVLATQAIGRSAKIKALITGLPLMIILKIVRVVYQFMAQLQVPHAFEIMFAAQIINQYILPFALWLAFTYKDVLKGQGHIFARFVVQRR